MLRVTTRAARDNVTNAPVPTPLTAADAATYAGVRPATLRVWRHRYGSRWDTGDRNLYDLEGLAAILARRAQVGP